MKKNTKKTLTLILAAIAAASTVTTASAARIEQNFASTPVTANLSNSSLPMGIDPVAGQRCYFNLAGDTDYKFDWFKMYVREPGSNSWKLESTYDPSGYFRYCYTPVTFWESGEHGLRLELALTDGRVATAEGSFNVQPSGTVSPTPQTRGEYRTWKQNDSRWGNAYIGSRTMSSRGCAITSVAMLAVKGGFESETSFNPGVLLQRLKNVGGFANNDIYWGSVKHAVSGMDYQGKVNLSGSMSNKIATIKRYADAGYLMVVAVKDFGHWVAVDSATSSKVTIMDPACNATDLFGTYSASGVVQIRLYK